MVAGGAECAALPLRFSGHRAIEMVALDRRTAGHRRQRDGQRGSIRDLWAVTVSDIIIMRYQYYYGTEKYRFWYFLIIFRNVSIYTAFHTFFGQYPKTTCFILLFDAFSGQWAAAPKCIISH